MVRQKRGKRVLILGLAGVLLFLGGSSALADSLLDRVRGSILLQVDAHGEAWYVHPETDQRFYMRNGDVVYEMKRSFGLGILDTDLASIPSVASEAEMLQGSSVCDTNPVAQRVRGRILLQVEQHGEAWYVYPPTCQRIYMEDGAAAYAIMRYLGLGITTNDLEQITVGPEVLVEEVIEEGDETIEDDVDDLPDGPYASLELRVHELINAHRASLGVAPLPWNNAMADIARVHSENMANEVVERGHEGFSERADEVGELFTTHRSVSENVAWTNHSDPAQSAFNWWLSSPGHKSNLEHTAHTATGIGVARSSEGVYHFTQLFVDAD